MLKTSLALLCIILAFAVSAQEYVAVGGIETPYKDKYSFSVKLDEKKKTLSFETDAPLSVITLEAYTKEERLVRKGREYTDKFYTKSGNVYTYDLTRTELKDQHAYWLKVSIGRNGIPLAEYYFEKKATDVVSEEPEEEKFDASGATVIRTNATCAVGKTKLIAALKKLDGVQKVQIDSKGTATINYSSDGTPYTDLLTTINENGFDANNQKTKNGAANPCKKAQ